MEHRRFSIVLLHHNYMRLLMIGVHSSLRMMHSRSVFIFCWLSTVAATIFCDPRASMIRLSFCHLSMIVDDFQNMNKTNNIEAKDMITGRNGSTTNNSSSILTNDGIGGGSVNEKKRRSLPNSRQQNRRSPSSSSSSSTHHDNKNTFENTEHVYNPSHYKSHLLFAIDGLDRYPNYLSRWKNNDIEALEQELRRVLREVKEQKDNTEEQRHCIQLALRDFFLEYPEWENFSVQPESWDEVREILDPRAANAIFRSQEFLKMTPKKSLKDVIDRKIQIKLDTGRLEEWMDEEMFDVYSFPLLSKTFCRKLYLYVSTIMLYMESSSRKCDIPVRSCYKDIDNLGLGWLNDLVFHLVLRPISALLYKDTELEGGDLDWRQGFIAAYSSTPTTSKPRQRLVPHTDDAEEITLNICLGDQFDGGDIHFWGIRGDKTAGNFIGEYQPEIGRAIIHSGRHLHEVTNVTCGDRFALIQWARCWGSSRNQVCPCCWLNRRPLDDKGRCVCGRMWN